MWSCMCSRLHFHSTAVLNLAYYSYIWVLPYTLLTCMPSIISLQKLISSCVAVPCCICMAFISGFQLTPFRVERYAEFHGRGWFLIYGENRPILRHSCPTPHAQGDDDGVSAPDLHCGRPHSHTLQPSSQRFNSTTARCNPTLHSWSN